MDFWNSYSNKNLSRYSLANLEQDDSISRSKFEEEKLHLNKIIDFSDYKNVLDLGGGVGIWAEYFLENCEKVTLVEKQIKFIEIAKSNITSNRIEYINVDLNDFESTEKYDFIFLSGVSIYFEDSEFVQLLKKIEKIILPNGVFVLRDAYGIDKEFFVDKISEELNLPYKAKYRTLEQYYKLIMSNTKLNTIYSEDMYKDALHFNKRKETRLRLMVFG